MERIPSDRLVTVCQSLVSGDEAVSTRTGGSVSVVPYLDDPAAGIELERTGRSKSVLTVCALGYRQPG
jgi:hypothetical protein